MKVLFVNQTYYPDCAATAQVLTDLTTAMAAEGHEVSVLCAREGYVCGYEALPRREVHRGVEIIRFGRFPRWIPKAARALLVSVGFALRLRFLPRYDVVVALTSPPLISWVCLRFGRFRSLVYWAMDINPEQAFQAGLITETSWLGRLLKSAHRRVLSRAAHVITLDRFMKETLLRSGAVENALTVLPVWGEELVSVPRAENRFRAELGLADRFVVMYSGNLSVCHPLDTVLQAAQELARDSSIVFVFIGGGPLVGEVNRFKAAHRLENILILPYQPRERLSESLSAADLHIVTMGQDYVGIVHPSKIYGIISVRRPLVLVGPKESGPADVLEEYRHGECVPHGDVAGLVQAIEGYRARVDREIESDLIERYSRARLVEEHIKLLREIT